MTINREAQRAAEACAERQLKEIAILEHEKRSSICLQNSYFRSLDRMLRDYESVTRSYEGSLQRQKPAIFE